MGEGFKVRDFVRPERAVRCRNCEPHMPRDTPAPKLQCYLGETSWPNGARRAVVVFVCCDCGEHRYLDLETMGPCPIA